MKRIYLYLLFLLGLSSSAFAQTGTVQGFCSYGGQTVKVSGMTSTTTVLATYPKCLVTVYQTGTTTLAPIYSDKNSTPLSNPFFAAVDASWVFWAKTGGGLDVTMSGGTPTPFPQPYTMVNTFPSSPPGSGGGGTPPAGIPTELQLNLNNTQLGGSKLFSNGSTYAYTPISQWAQYSVNNPILNYCGNAQCGDVRIYGQNSPVLDGTGAATGYGHAYYNYRKALYTGLSGFNGNGNDPNDPPGGSVISLQSDVMVTHSPSIGQVHGSALYCAKPGDCAGLYSYLYAHGGYRYGGDEGDTNIRANGGLDYTRQGGFQVSGTAGVGARTVNASIMYGPDDALVGGFVYDFSATPIASGNITAYDAPNHLLTVTPGSVTPATNAGTTTTAINISTAEENAVNGVSKTVSINVTQGTGFTINNTDPVYLACGNPDLEIVVPTAVGTLTGGSQTITANFMHGHAAGCKVGQGGTVGVLDLPADRIGNNWKTSWFVFAAPDNSHIYEVSFLGGGRGFINPWRHNFGGGQNTVTNANISGDGTTTKACNLGQSGANFTGQYVQISGATPSSFNGIYQAGAFDKNGCISFPGSGTGTATGATIAVGGAINSPDGTIQGPGGFKIWTTARVRQIGTSSTTVNGVTTNAYNNTFIFDPNNFNFINGHTVLILDDMQAKVEPLAAYGVFDVAPNNNVERWFTAMARGWGVATPAFHMASVINQNPYNWYKGGGSTGQLDGPLGLSIEGPFATNIWMHQPLQGGFGILMVANTNMTNPNVNNTFFPLFVQGGGGGLGAFTISTDPNAGRTIISAGTGNGISSTLDMTPTNMVLGASTGTLSAVALTYKFTGLSGASTRAVTVDATGTLGTTSIGTVTSVGVTAPTWMGVSGSPITSSGSITFNPAVFGASGASHSVGIVPDPGASAGTTRFLREDGTWQVPTTTGFSGSCAPTTTATVVNGLITGCS